MTFRHASAIPLNVYVDINRQRKREQITRDNLNQSPSIPWRFIFDKSFATNTPPTTTTHNLTHSCIHIDDRLGHFSPVSTPLSRLYSLICVNASRIALDIVILSNFTFSYTENHLNRSRFRFLYSLLRSCSLFFFSLSP